MKKSRVGLREDSEPIKTVAQLNSFCHELKRHGKFGIRNYTAFMLGVKCLLRPSDVLKLGFGEVYNPDGTVKTNIKTRDKKTNKYNLLWLGSSKNDLIKYRQWYIKNGFTAWYQNNPSWYQKAYNYYYQKWLKYRDNWNQHTHEKGRKIRPFIRPPKSGWLFPTRNNRAFPMSRNAFYVAVKRSANNLGMQNISAHSCRKTGAYFVYKQNHNDIALTQHLLNHKSSSTTLKYLNLNRSTDISKLKHIKY